MSLVANEDDEVSMGSRSPIKHQPAVNATAANEAAEWLATLTDSACSAEERQGFAAWLRRSNLHVEEFLRLSVLARHLNEPSIWNDVSVATLVTEALASKDVIAHVARSGKGARQTGVPRTLRWLLPLAAACTTVAALLLFLNREIIFPSGTTYATEVGEQRSIALEDGSVVALNTGSRLHTRFTAAERTVELLQGEAIFKVMKNPQRPFRVLSGPSEIVAVGTEFNVYARSAGTVVTVLEGRVRVSHANDADASARHGATQIHEYEIELARGEQAVISPQRPIVRTVLEDPAKATAWTERRLIFEETPLAAAIAEFARYYKVKIIRIADPKLAQLHITGVFDASDPASLVDFLKAFGDVDIKEDERGWIVGTQPADSTVL